MTKIKSRHAFTLIEIVVATTLLGLVGLIIGTSLSTFQRALTRTQRIADWLDRNQAIDRLAETALRSAIPFKWPNTEEEEEQNVFLGESDELWLTAMNRSYGQEGAFRFVRIYLEENELRVDYSPYPLLPWLELGGQNYETELISPAVQEILFTYAAYNEDGDLTWYERWDEDEQGVDAFPLAIQLTIIWEDGTTERWLRRTAGTSTNTEYLSGTAVSTGTRTTSTSTSSGSSSARRTTTTTGTASGGRR